MKRAFVLVMLAVSVFVVPAPSNEAAGFRDQGGVVVLDDAQTPDLPLQSDRSEGHRTAGGQHRFVAIDTDTVLRDLPTDREVVFQLFDGFEVAVDAVEWTADADGHEHWIGRRDNAVVSLTKVGDAVEGLFQPGDLRSPVVLIHIEGTTHLLAEDVNRYPTELKPLEIPETEQPRALDLNGREVEVPEIAEAEAPARIQADGTLYTIDVLVWYDQLALAHHGGSTSAAELAFTASIDTTNAAAIVSDTTARFNLVGIASTTWTPPASPNTALEQITEPYDGVLDSIHAARDAVDADLVVFVTDVSNFCGVAWLPGSAPSTATDGFGFSLIDADCTGANLTIPHEIGHNMGAGHDVGASQPGPGLYSYSQGYINPAESYRTIMSYSTACPGCSRIPNFSSSSVLYDGNPTGSATIDNARTISEGAAGVSGYRPHPCPPPPGDDAPGHVDLGSPYSTSWSGTNVCATLGSEVYYTVTAPVQSVWLEWIAPVSGTATVSTCSAATEFDTWVTIFTDPTQFPIGFGNDDGSCPHSTTHTTTSFTATAGQSYYFSVDSVGAAEGAFDLSVSIPPPGLEVLDQPCVVYDSSTATATGLAGTMSGDETRTVQVAGTLTDQGGAASCLPADTTTALLRVSSIDPLTEGNLRMTPAGVAATGGAGVVNYGAANGLNNANMVSIPLSAGGAVDVQANAGPLGTVATTDVRIVAVAYHSTSVTTPLRYTPLNPCAVADSRPNKGADDSHDGPNDDGLWPAGSDFPDIDVVGDFPSGQGGNNGVGNTNGNPTSCGVPITAEAVMLNVVSVAPAGAPGWISVDRGRRDPIMEATTPFAPLTPNMANGSTTVVALAGGETISLDVDGLGAETKVRVEILGYFDDATGLDFAPITPCAAFDSRSNKGATGAFAGLRQHGPTNATTYRIAGDIPVSQGGVVASGGDPTTGTCEVPAGASAVLVNVEAVNAEREGNFWISAGGTTTTGGLLNFNDLTPKMNNANAVVVPLDANGDLRLEVNAGSFTSVGTEVAHARGVILGYYG